MNIFIFLLIAVLLYVIADVLEVGYLRILIYFIAGVLLSALSTAHYMHTIRKKQQFIQFRDKSYPNFADDKEYKHWLIDHPKKKNR